LAVLLPLVHLPATRHRHHVGNEADDDPDDGQHEDSAKGRAKSQQTEQSQEGEQRADAGEDRDDEAHHLGIKVELDRWVVGEWRVDERVECRHVFLRLSYLNPARLHAVSYQTAVGGWHDFYILAGTAAATLVGLLFVGLSLHLQIVVSALEVRSLARVTLANFGAVLVVALFIVIPQGPSAAGSQLVGAGVVSLVVAAPSLVGAVRSGDWSFDMSLMQRVRV